MLEMIQIFNDLNSLHDTDMSWAEPLEVFQGGVDHLFFTASFNVNAISC